MNVLKLRNPISVLFRAYIPTVLRTYIVEESLFNRGRVTMTIEHVSQCVQLQQERNNFTAT